MNILECKKILETGNKIEWRETEVNDKALVKSQKTGFSAHYPLICDTELSGFL